MGSSTPVRADEQEPYAGAVPLRPFPRSAHLPWRSIALRVLGLWLVSRLALVVFTYFAVILNAQGTNKPPMSRSMGPDALLNAWNRWDVGWYTSIALHGYHDATSTAFFPFFPLTTHLLTLVIGASNVVAAAMIVANVGMLVACIAIGWLAANEFGASTANFAVKAALAYPMAFFTFAGYSDSWFLAWCALTLLFARRDMWLAAASTAFLAGVSRPVALVLILPLLWEGGRQLHERGMLSRHTVTLAELGRRVLAVAAVPLALAVWGAYLLVTFGNPLLWTRAQANGWDHQTIMPWNTVHIAITTLQATPGWTFPQARVLMDLGAVVLFALLTVIGIRRLPVMFTLYMACVIGVLVTAAVPLDFDPFNAESRYILMSAPIFALLGYWMSRRSWVDLLVMSGFLLQGVFTAFWLRGGWIV